MSFVFYDLSFLVIFTAIIFIFIYRNRDKLKRELGIAYLYKTQGGVKLINHIGRKYKKTLTALKYPIIIIGYLLMLGVIYLIARTVYLYVRYPLQITSIVKAPPIAPVIPYFPKLFGMSSFFPPFYFTYFILALAVVAFVHEFSHGIYMVLNKVRIKSTGVLFLGPILGAFVEQDDRDMDKISKTNQMSILAAGVFANIVFAGIFLLVWWGLFYATFVPAGAMFNTYGMQKVEVGSITEIGGISIIDSTHQGLLDVIDGNNLTDDLILGDDGNPKRLIKIIANNNTYYREVDVLERLLEVSSPGIFLFGDFPAINAGLRGRIISIDDYEIETYDQITGVLENYRPGDEIKVTTIDDNNDALEFNIILAEHPTNPYKAFLGVGNTKIKMNIAEALAFFKDPFTHYEPRSQFLVFIYFLAFWIFLLNLLVGFFNMLPAAALDGGRFFYLTILGITKNKKLAQLAFKWSGILILAAFALMLASWLFGISQ